MPGFETIAKPHSDIAHGKFTLDTYAAKLGNVVKSTGNYEYRNAKRFFQKTYVTDGLKRLLSVVERRLKGNGGDAIVQLQTPFGGGKTHTLIALYHKAKEWDAKPIVIVGSEMDARETFWGKLEMQLTGKTERFKGHLAPGIDSISELLKVSDSPVLILMDEMLNYLTRAGGVSVKKVTLAEQTMAFMLSLTEAVASCQHVAFIVSLQSSEIGPLEEKFQLFTQLLARMKRVITPVEDNEIGNIIRTRLFSKIDEKGAKRIVREYTNSAQKEGILPENKQASEYRKDFQASYPFQPEVIDVLYKRWGSFPDFQRTRGVLRLLSRVVSRTVKKNRPYITLADFDLADADIRAELLEHAGQEYQSILSSDITTRNQGAKTVDGNVGSAYQLLELGTRTATAIFLYSFTGGSERRGTSRNQIKRSATLPDIPVSVVDTAINELSERLFYLRTENDNYYFDTQPNLTRILQIHKENVDAGLVTSRADKELNRCFKATSHTRLKTYIAPKTDREIPDEAAFKLIVLPERDDAFCRKLVEKHGEQTRVNRNTLFFLTPHLGHADTFLNKVKEVLAYDAIHQDTSLNLSKEQKKEVASKLASAPDELNNALCSDYRMLLIPNQEGFCEKELGISASGMNTLLAGGVYETLCANSQILKKIGARNISELYLKEPESELYLKEPEIVLSSQLLNSSLRTPGEKRRALRDVWEDGIIEGVEAGLFAIGEQCGGKLIPHHFKNTPRDVTMDGAEVLIKPELILENITAQEILSKFLKKNDSISTSAPFYYSPDSGNASRPLRAAWENAIRDGVKRRIFGVGEKIGDELTQRAFGEEPGKIRLSDTEVLMQAALCKAPVPPVPPEPPGNGGGIIDEPPGEDDTSRKSLHFAFRVPSGTVNDMALQVNSLQGKFREIQIVLKAMDGEISEDDYEQLKADFEDSGIDVEEEV